jgi:hypothetical protein
MTLEVQNAGQSERKALEAFVVDNKDLERLESLLTEFNIFEAIGAVQQEERHSDFLSYLLDPQKNHGLRETFVRKFLQRAVSLAGEVSVPISQIDLATWNLADFEVRREWQSIDILLRSETNRLVVVIENKIGTTEHDNQLERYWNDTKTTLRQFLEELIKSQSELVFDHSSKELIKFTLKTWDVPGLKGGQGWTPSGRMLLFEFQNRPESLKLKLIIGPGPRDTRERLLKIALDNRPPFKPAANFLNKFYNEIYSFDFLTAKAYSDAGEQDLETKIREHWARFLESELPILAKFDWTG